jgi:coproporphyrinogen III oxidase
MQEPDIQAVRRYFLELQDSIQRALEDEDSGHTFLEDCWERSANGAGIRGGGRTRVLSEGTVLEKAGINFSHVQGEGLPPSATANRPVSLSPKRPLQNRCGGSVEALI